MGNITHEMRDALERIEKLEEHVDVIERYLLSKGHNLPSIKGSKVANVVPVKRPVFAPMIDMHDDGGALEEERKLEEEYERGEAERAEREWERKPKKIPQMKFVKFKDDTESYEEEE